MLNYTSFVIIAARHLEKFFERNPSLLQSIPVTDFRNILKKYQIQSYATVYEGFSILLPYKMKQDSSATELFIFLQRTLNVGFLLIPQRNLPSHINALLNQPMNMNINDI